VIVMVEKVRPAALEFNAKDSQLSPGVARQLRLPLMAREEGPTGQRLRNIPPVEELRIFLVRKSHVPAKIVAKATGSRPTRIHNEDEARVLLSSNTTVFRFLDLSDADAARFLNRLAALRGMAPYRAGLRDLDDSAVSR
jgi:hypothetical protein